MCLALPLRLLLTDEGGDGEIDDSSRVAARVLRADNGEAVFCLVFGGLRTDLVVSGSGDDSIV